MAKKLIGVILAIMILALPVCAFAAEDNPDGVIVDELAESDTMAVNKGVVSVNKGTISENQGIVSDNMETVSINKLGGLIEINTGAVSDNYGVVGANLGVITNNFGIVENNENGKIVNNYYTEGEYPLGEIENSYFLVNLLGEISVAGDGIVKANGKTWVKKGDSKITVQALDGYEIKSLTVTPVLGYADDLGGNEFGLRGIAEQLTIQASTSVTGTVENNPAGTTVQEHGEGETMMLNEGTINTNKGWIDINLGTVGDNIGDIMINEGTTETNQGGIQHNYGTVGANMGVIYNNFATVVNNEYGTIVNNYYAGGEYPQGTIENPWLLISIEGDISVAGENVTECNGKMWIKPGDSQITVAVKEGYVAMEEITVRPGLGSAVEVGDGIYDMKNIRDVVVISGKTLPQAHFDNNEHIGGMATCVDSAECELCGMTYGTPDENAHRFEEYVSDGNATCAADGTATALCEYGCGAKDTIPEEGTILDHSAKDAWDNNETDHWKTCRECGVQMDETLGKHVFGEWSVITEATADKPGERRRFCEDCGYVQREEYFINDGAVGGSTSEDDSGENTSDQEKDPVKPEQEKDPDIPKTGDDSSLMLWIVLLAVCGAGFVLVCRLRKSR